MTAARVDVRAVGGPVAITLALALGPAVAQGFGRFAYALLVPPMRAELGWSLAEAGGVASANAAGYLLGALVASAAASRLGTHRALALGLAGTVAGLLAMAWAPTYGVVLAVRLGAGVAGAVAFVAGGSLSARLAHEIGRSTPLVVYFGGGGIGIALSGIGVPWVVGGHDGGWRIGWVVLAGLGVVCSAVAVRAAATVAAPHAPRERHAGRLVLRSLHVAYGLFGAGYVAYTTFVVALLADRGHGVSFQALFWVVLGALAVVASFGWGHVAATARGTGPLVAANALTALGVLLLLVSESAVMALTSAVVFGGSFLAVSGTVTAAARSLTPPDGWTRVIGSLTAAFAVGQCAGPVMAGVLSDRPAGIEAGLVLSFGLLVAAAAVSLRRPERPPST